MRVTKEQRYLAHKKRRPAGLRPKALGAVAAPAEGHLRITFQQRGIDGSIRRCWPGGRPEGNFGGEGPEDRCATGWEVSAGGNQLTTNRSGAVCPGVPVRSGIKISPADAPSSFAAPRLGRTRLYWKGESSPWNTEVNSSAPRAWRVSRGFAKRVLEVLEGNLDFRKEPDYIGLLGQGEVGNGQRNYECVTC
jgi:hypothetical protein